MKTNEITAENYQQTMGRIWSIVRGYCDSDREAANCITMAVENYLYDTQGGASEYRAIQTAMDELGVESDYMMEFAEGLIALGVEPSWDDEEDDDGFLDEYLGLESIPLVCRI